MTKVLLYSGGMDSYALRHLWKPDVSLYVNLGTEYSAAEMAMLDDQTTVVDFPGLLALERPDKIIPLRNLFLVSIAAQYGNEIALAATAGDRVLDKSFRFASKASGVLTLLMNDYWSDRPGDYEVVLPVKSLTKRQLVEAYIKAGGDPLKLAECSLSCYQPIREWNPTLRRLKPCGRCKPCFRKWVAFKLNGFDTEPNAKPYIEAEILPQILAGRYGRAEEEAEILEAIGYVSTDQTIQV